MSRPFYSKLVVRQGPKAGQEFELAGSEVVIGRDAAADFVIEGQGVSRRHARVFVQGDAYAVEDLGSSNGTFLNGEKLAGSAFLNPGDRIGLGQSVTLMYEAAPAEEPDESEDYGGTLMVQPGTSGGAEPSNAMREPASGAAHTVLGGEEMLPEVDLSATPPQFTVAIAGDPPDAYTLTADVLTIGRADDNDIVISSKIVSRHHARLERADGGYRLVTLPEAGNPVLFEGRPLSGPRRLRHEDKFRIGGQDPGLMVTLTYDSPAEAFITERELAVDFGSKAQIAIGRAPDNDVVLDTPQVSRYHAQVERIGQRYRVRDLRSSNGTFVNDEQVEGEVWLSPEDEIRIGPNRFVLGQDQLAQFDESGGRRVDATGLNKWVRKDLNILQDISLVLQPREFVVVVGQSGGGKSTLVDAIAGYRPATHGQVLVNDIDVYKNFDAIRSDIGFVPQRDIIHMELTVFQALDYAAQLRMPSDTTEAERHQRVQEVLEDLDLAHRADVQISGLSGGQQKRVSIGVELLTKPGLFFLDEPTSGLDPGTETALMQLMRRLADQGRTIILVTHATKNVMLADKVIFLARGGYLAWFGPPDEALKYFDQYRSDRDRRASNIEFDDIYAILEQTSNGTPEEWSTRFRQHSAYQQYIVQPLQQRGRQTSDGVTVSAQAPTRGRQISSLRQFLILSARNLKILTRDRFALGLMLATAPIVGLLDLVLAALLGRNPFDYNTGNVFNSLIILFMLPLYGAMVGALAMMREIVKEQEIYKRERLVNLKILPYVLSKVWIAVILALYQAAAYTIIRHIAFDMPGGFFEFSFVYITMVMATLAGMMLGLFGSALAPNSNSAPLIVIMFMLPQIVLGGALIPLPTFISAPTVTRWGYEGLMATSGIGSDVAKDTCWTLPEEARSAMTLEDKQELGCNCSGLAILDQNSCDFPSLGRFSADPSLQEPLPEEPVEPPEPVLPPQPVEPEDQSDQIAMAEYFDALEVWQGQVEEIQANYRVEVDLYQAEAITYQTEVGKRELAIGQAEGLVGQLNRDMGWAFVDKDSPAVFFSKVLTTWLAQAFICALLFVGILVLQKRKDVV